MKNIALSILLFSLTFVAKSQNVISALGGGGTVGTMSISYTVGEAVVSTIENNAIKLNQGFHQPRYVLTAIKETFPEGAVKVFPNPTTSILEVQLEGIALENIQVSLTDVAGRNIADSKVYSTHWQTDISNLADGYYVLTVSDIKNLKSNSFKIFKSN